jgi:hypothetical protein
MILWFALVVPVIVTFIGYYYWHHKITILELVIPIALSIIAITISYFTLKEKNIQDVEYNGSLVVEARYYEYWSTWVDQTCTRTYDCGTKESPRTCTEYYDCSYCDRNSAYWQVILANGHVMNVSESKWNELVKKWNTTPQFVDLERRIVKNGSCGEDGNMYRIRWNGRIETSESAVWTVNFRNPVKISHSAFRYLPMTDKEASDQGLYQYPKFKSYLRQDALLSYDFEFKEIDHLQLEYINGLLGPRNKVKTFTLLFKNKPVDVAFKQEQYWEGGNQNELVVCIGVDDSLRIQWVQPFSWCDNKRINVETREDIAELGLFKAQNVAAIYYKNIPKYFKYKSFKDFNYLRFEPTMSQILWVYFITLIVSVLATVFIVKNDLDPETKLF